MSKLQVRVDDGPSEALNTPLRLAQALRHATTIEVRRAESSAVATNRSDGSWRVEIRDPGRAEYTSAPNTDAAYDLLRSWCNEDGWESEAFGWAPLPR